jgi:hypothetical protein
MRSPSGMRTDAETTQSYSAGTLAGTGSFYCDTCGFAVALHERDQIPACPHCNGTAFRRASIFADPVAEPVGTHQTESPSWLAGLRDELAEGDHIAYVDGDERHVLALDDEFVRIGRSLAADIRFDDPTVSRRHAILHRHDRGVRILDDRSLNGVFVNGERVHAHELSDGDEVVIGRFHLYFVAAPRGRFTAGGGRRAAIAR